MPAPSVDDRSYQVEAIEEIRKKYTEGFRKVLLVAPTGSGKTVMFSHVVHKTATRGNRALILAHRKELIEQASAKLDAYGVDHGVIMASHPRWKPHLPVQVASVQTLAKRKIPPADLLVIDEAHHARAGTYNKIIDALPGALVLGCTASPWRTDNRPLGDLFETIVVASTPKKLTELGFLVPCTGFAFDNPDLKSVKITAGDYNEKQLGEIMSGSKIMGNVVEQWATRANGVRTVLFAVNIEHSKKLVEEFKSRGVSAEHLDGTTPRQTREDILKRLASGETRLVSNVGVLTEGWDCPAVECCILARPTMSVGLYLQMVGRIRRPYAGKEKARVHDHAGNVLRHGLPDQERDYSLAQDSGARRGKNNVSAVEPVRQCQGCFALYPPDLEGCPLCGFKNPQRIRKIEEVDGVAITFEEIEKGYAPPDESQMKRDFNEWCNIAMSRKYQPGWIYHRFKAKYGFPPPKSWSK